MVCIGINKEKTWADVVNGRFGVVCGVVGEEGGGAKKLNFGGGNFSGNIIGGELDVLGDWVWKLWIIKSYPLDLFISCKTYGK